MQSFLIEVFNHCHKLILIIQKSGFNLWTYSHGALYYTPEPRQHFDFDKLFLGLDNATIKAISHQPSDFIKNCTVNGRVTQQCRILMSEGGHKRYLGSTYGLCYSYNVEDPRSKLDSIIQNNEYVGLELLIDMEGCN